jgi:exodeoxyribonuclease VII large subunit
MHISDDDIPGAADAPIYSVSELNREARRVLETGLAAVWVAGEVSNLVRPGSGHLYFSLKDEQAQVRCAMFRRANRSLTFRLEDGLQVIVHARVSIYEPRGSYQLIVEQMEPAGEGLLRRRFEELKARLAAEGLFAAELKQPLPKLPRSIGIITSPSGAAVRDILHILRRRFAAVPAIIYPVTVQGDQAQGEIVAALDTAARRAECDVLIVGRGGGSLEDLWAFNEESVARAIHACPIPVISAVGHEIDFTISDLVADVRAPTPSGAAELAVPDAHTWAAAVGGLEVRTRRAVVSMIAEQRVAEQHLATRLRRCDPGFVLSQHAQRLDELTARLSAAAQRRLELERLHLDHIHARLCSAAPSVQIQAREQYLGTLRLRLNAAMQSSCGALRSRLAVAAAGLQAFSPLSTLERGYAIIQDSETGAVIRDAAVLQTGQEITGRLARGSFTASIRKTLAR